MMNEPVSPARLGIPADLAARFETIGLIQAGTVIPPAVSLFLGLRSGPDPVGAVQRVAEIMEAAPELSGAALDDQELQRNLVAISGASRALSRTLAVFPGWLRPGDTERATAEEGSLFDRVRRSLLDIAVRDLTGQIAMPQVGIELSDLADAVASAALDEVGESLRTRPEFAGDLPFAVIAMGKWGGRELNYASDIDVLFVFDVPEGLDQAAATQTARKLAEGFMAALGTVTPEGVAWRVDPDLRPEGKAGALARSLDAYRHYYERWAEPWEFQALIKARHAAGDPRVGARFLEMTRAFVYLEELPDDSVREIRAMKGRAERDAARRGAGAELKRGIGGIRDVEFAAQLLQLVHGRSDPALRSAATLDVLGALSEGGYIRPEDGSALTSSYQWLRDVEHRIQLWDLRQTHELPAGAAGRERVAKAMGFRDEPGRSALDQFERDLVRHRASVRTIHERLFYRPLLEAFARSPSVRLTEEGAARQLAALGFNDVAGAQKAFSDLTAGLSRRSSLMQQLLPLMLDWLSQSPHPDLGLHQLRLLVSATPDNARLVGELRDSPVAAERLCRLLGTSRLLARMVDQIPESLGVIGDDDALDARSSPAELQSEIASALALRPDIKARLGSLRHLVIRRLLRTAARDLLGRAGPAEVGSELSDLADAAVQAAVDLIAAGVRQRPEYAALPTVAMTVVAMGKWGGRELNYASDLDALFVYRPPDGADPELVRSYAHAVAEDLLQLGASAPAGTAFRLDADLRPEGRQGPLVRSLDSYRSYYDRWARTWEFQSLVKARCAAGDAELGSAFLAMVEPLVYREQVTGELGRDIRTMKARVEQERITPGEDPAFHMKLGPGGLADVEFTAQLLQLLHGGELKDLRVTGTREALRALERAGLLSPDEARRLLEAYDFCAHVRNRLFLQAGRPRDSLPTDPAETNRLAISLGFELHPRSSLREAYRRRSRRARRVVERRFYGH